MIQDDRIKKFIDLFINEIELQDDTAYPVLHYRRLMDIFIDIAEARKILRRLEEEKILNLVKIDKLKAEETRASRKVYVKTNPTQWNEFTELPPEFFYKVTSPRHAGDKGIINWYDDDILIFTYSKGALYSAKATLDSGGKITFKATCLYLSPHKGLYREGYSEDSFCYPIKKRRFTLVRAILSGKKDARTLMNLTGIGQTSYLTKEINEINKITKQKTGLEEDLIVREPVGGYQINPRYQITSEE